MISKIEIKRVATYDETGTSLNDLKDINFIYGANGSGKTTVSNLMSSPDEIKYQHCNVIWKDGLRLDTMVYNKFFKEIRTYISR